MVQTSTSPPARRVRILGAGGTIAMSGRGGATVELDAAGLLAVVRELTEVVDIETETIVSLPSAHLTLEDLRGRVVVLNFWASWCIPACYDEAPTLERTWQAYKDKGVIVVGVNVQDTEEPARKFLARFGHSFPNAPDPKGHVAVDYGVYGVPETFFIGRDGKIVDKILGLRGKGDIVEDIKKALDTQQETQHASAAVVTVQAQNKQ